MMSERYAIAQGGMKSTNQFLPTIDQVPELSQLLASRSALRKNSDMRRRHVTSMCKLDSSSISSS